MGLGQKWLFFCALVIAHHCPCIHKKKQGDGENERPMTALKKPLSSRKALMIEQISMDSLGNYCSRNRRRYEVYPDCTTSAGFISTLSWTAVLALPVKLSAREEFVCGTQLGAEQRSVSTKECETSF